MTRAVNPTMFVDVSVAPASFDLMHVIGLLASAGLAVIGWVAARHAQRARSTSARDTRSARSTARDPVARPLAWLSFDIALWTFATTLFAMTGEPAWHWLDVTFSPLTPPLVLHLVLAYTGASRRLATVLGAAYLVFGLLAVSSALAFIAPWARAWIGSRAWSIAYLAGWLPLMALALVLLVQALRRAREVPLAAMRTRLLIAGLLVAGLLGSTELWDDLVKVPSLGALGAFVAMSIMAAVVLRFDLLVGTIGRTLALYAASVSVIAVAALALVLNTPALGGAAALSLVAIIVALVALAVREVVRSGSERAARTLSLASLGRFSAQMAHDLKNPLAAMKGAVQYLEAARAPERPDSTDAPDMIELLGKQVARMEAIIDRYGRLARVEVTPARFELDALVEDLARAARAAGPSLDVTVDAQAPGPFHGDRDLVAGALDNLVKNAREAMAGGGQMTLRTRRRGDLVELEVEDTGPGIDARFVEHVADDFFTTRAEGSGLGLAFVRRVAAAHGGALAIDSAPGRGTRVRVTLLELPEVR